MALEDVGKTPNMYITQFVLEQGGQDFKWQLTTVFVVIWQPLIKRTISIGASKSWLMPLFRCEKLWIKMMLLVCHVIFAFCVKVQWQKTAVQKHILTWINHREKNDPVANCYKKYRWVKYFYILGDKTSTRLKYFAGVCL